MNTQIMKGKRCRKTLRRCLVKGAYYCVSKNNSRRRSRRQRRCRRGTRRCVDGTCHKILADTLPLPRS
jgi:hypothetical protein